VFAPPTPSAAPDPAAAPGAPGGPDDEKEAHELLEGILLEHQEMELEGGLSFEMPELEPLLSCYDGAKELFDRGDFKGVLDMKAKLEGALDKLRKASAAFETTKPQKRKTAAATADTIAKMPEADIKKLRPAAEADLVKKMLAAGAPDKAVRDAQKRLYASTDLDPAFVKADQGRQQQIADALKGDKELKAAEQNWNKLAKSKKPKDETTVRRTLEKIIAIQSKVYGIPPPKLELIADEEDAAKHTNSGGRRTAVVVGAYEPSKKNVVQVNLHPNNKTPDFKEAIKTVLHENAHRFQQDLVDRLGAKKLKPGDPDFDQALLFEANKLNLGGYLNGEIVGEATYKTQPVEKAAYMTAEDTAARIVDALK
jgi:hypothetical protein